MLDYDGEAAIYDLTRGGEPRARAAAEAVASLLPPSTRVLVDAACGTGSVTALLRSRGRRVLGVDLSHGMARVAASRLRGTVVLGDATALPLPGSSVDAVTTIWLFHLLNPGIVARVLSEAARVVRPGGALITTVDKHAAIYDTGCDVAALLGPVRARHLAAPSDALDTVAAMAARHGLSVAGRTTFTGHGQGGSPRAWRAMLASGELHWARRAEPAELAALDARLAALPGQERPRPDPVYTVIKLATSSAHRKRVRAGGRRAP
ncbi:class I SAM-dependent methyltransferase [Nonomuraea sp. NPDC059194]|uniref:class I SAM-dependent methyltransferase n=1 Tax=Nonomuraea sp. NPDC059194 TaxID=3346764 RepID=UPI003674E1D2